MKKKPPHPPKWATKFLELYCREELLEDLQGDLNEFFDRNWQKKGALMARLIYLIDVLKFFRPYTVRKPSITNPLNNKVMFANYFKTSARVIMRNKLFSGINIIGMAVSLSVGLMVIAFLSDLFSYDSTIKNKERIVRVISSFQMAGQPPMKLASSSWKAGVLIRQQVPGAESVTILKRGFGGDAKIGESTIPVSGLYADENFFNIFSFPLIKGVAATALKEPHSIILTQTTTTKLFGHDDPMGKIIKFDTVNYTVTGVLADIPKLSHIDFEMLISLSSLDANETPIAGDGRNMDWTNFFSNYVYVLLSKNTDPASFTAALNRISTRENAALTPDHKVFLEAQPLLQIHLGHSMGNEAGPVTDPIQVVVLSGLALIIILSACFNYTNLSIARSLKRSREVGIRKVVGARRIQVIGQFIAESVILSLVSLVLAFFLFLLLRGQLFSINPGLEKAFSLELSTQLIGWFIVFAVVIGIIAGILPALFYSKINAVQVLKDASAIKVFRHLSLRKALVVVQYTFSLMFITATIIQYKQYKGFLRFDLGFTTENILNIKMQGNKDEVLAKELATLPAVKGISRSLIVSSLGSIFGSQAKYTNPADSAEVDENYIDAGYLPLHKYSFLAGHNFTPQPKDAPETETIVNEQLLKRFDIGHNDPQKALGEMITIGKNRLRIIGVLKDFHYGALDRKIQPTAFRYGAEPGGYLNVKIITGNLPATMTSIETLWKQVDKVHPLDANFYDDQITNAYSFMTVTVKIIGFFSALAICISSLGLFGMVLYTMERRIKEISIRKVLGAGQGMLILLLSRNFLLLLAISAAIALPLTWLIFEKGILTHFAYHQPIGFGDIFIGLLIVATIAFTIIGIQTLKTIRTNPADVLKNE